MAAELGLGAVLGVGIGEAVFLLVGSGGWQLGLGLIVAALAGRILDRGTLFTMQAGVNAMVVIGMGNLAGTTGGVDRMLDAVKVDRIAVCTVDSTHSATLPLGSTRPKALGRSSWAAGGWLVHASPRSCQQ